MVTQMLNLRTNQRTVTLILGAVVTAIVGTLIWAPASGAAVLETVAKNPLTLFKAIVLGVVEGVTEFLPISSTGHLLVASRIMDIGQEGTEQDALNAFLVVVQIGAIIAVLGIYRNRFTLMIEGVRGKSAEGLRLLNVLVVSFLPAAVIGVLLGDVIKERLLGSWPVVIAWIVGGIAILFFEKKRSELTVVYESVSELTIRHALFIGLAQSAAMWPGTSRSLVTIIAGLILGMSVHAAVEYSFLLGFVTLGAATGYELLGSGSLVVDNFGIAMPILATVVAGIAAFVSVKFMLDWLQKKGLAIFGWYRIAAGIGTAALILTDVI